MSGHDPMTSYFSVSCCYFETTDEKSTQLETYIIEVVAVGNVLINCIYIILNSFLASIFLHYDYLCGTLHPVNFLHAVHCFLAPSPPLWSDVVYKFPWGTTKITPWLTGTPPHISLLPKMNILLTSQGGMV